MKPLWDGTERRREPRDPITETPGTKRQAQIQAAIKNELFMWEVRQVARDSFESAKLTTGEFNEP